MNKTIQSPTTAQLIELIDEMIKNDESLLLNYGVDELIEMAEKKEIKVNRSHDHSTLRAV